MPHKPFVIARDSFLILLAAFIVRYDVHEWIEPYAPFHFFMVACLIIAFRYGYKSALICLMISVFVGNYFFVQPYETFGPATISDFIQTFNFLAVTAVAIGMVEKLQRTIYAQKLLIQVMRDRQRSMLFRQNEQLHKVRSLEASQ